MKLLHALGGHLMQAGLRLASRRRHKARLIVEGRRETVSRLRQRIDGSRPVVWVHASSLGEFEQGRPLIETIGRYCPEWQIVLSFFSPSGYEVRHSYEGVDCVVYLPADTPRAVRAFLDSARPSIAIFVKYDFWPVMLRELRTRGIRSYLVSAIFREEQLFFKPWGGWYRRLLHDLDYLYVQDRASLALLARHGVYHADVAGDTRFDRAYAIAQAAKDVPEAEALARRTHTTIVAGSTWGEDEAMLIDYWQRHEGVGLIIAPHEIDAEHMARLTARLGRKPWALLSQLRQGQAVEGYECLVVDCFGLLSSLYRYADVAYIGGGFGKGIHNTVEAAVYGVPMLFGPRIDKFREAKLFVASGAGIVVRSGAELEAELDRLVSSAEARHEAAQAAMRIVESQLGATKIILDGIGLCPKPAISDNEDEQRQ